MIIKCLKLVNFRNYSSLKLDFNPGINFIYGDNAKGKTNIVEAIYYFMLARSFRTNFDADLIRFKEDSSYLECLIDNHENMNKIAISLLKNGKQILVNDKRVKKITELNEYFNAIYFIPKDVNLLKDSPKDRRQFLNIIISKLDSHYLELLLKYEKFLKERNLILKKEPIDFNYLDIVTEELIKYSSEIYSLRKKYLDILEEKLNITYQKITNKFDKFRIIYKTFVDGEDYFLKAKESFKASLAKDLETQTTNVGIQRDDFLVLKSGKSVGSFGSQGENRITVLSLKLAYYFMNENNDFKPIIILDDVLSELDQENETRLIALLSDFDQVFITSTKKYEILKANYIALNEINKNMEVNL